jgi:hypothetical protein
LLTEARGSSGSEKVAEREGKREREREETEDNEDNRRSRLNKPKSI